MKVGILTTCQHSVFSGGLANTTIVLYEMMKTLEHEVTILNTDKEWYDDCKSLKEHINMLHITTESNYDFDLVIECVSFFQSEEERKRVGKRFVVFNRHNILLPTIEYSLYPIVNRKNNYDGVEQIWCFKELCDESEKQMLEVLTRKPVVLLPYLWTPTIIETHKNELNLPLWLQMPHTAENWSPHVFETNTSSSSSSTIPLLILRQAKLNNFPITKYKIHNIEQINKSQFFKDNVLKHCELADLSGEFVGRQRIIDLIVEPKSCVISHVRFIPFKPMIFDMAWFGIPFIHNSSFLKHISCFERYYYPDNKISEAVKCLEHINEDFIAKEGWFKIENIQEFRKYILENHSCFNPAIIEIYKNVVNNPINLNLVSNTLFTPSLAASEPCLSILFTDMWENFNPSYNFFTLLLESANPNIKIKYYSESTLKGVPTAIIFGPFGTRWKNYETVPKIHYTGENTPPVSEAKLNLGFAIDFY